MNKKLSLEMINQMDRKSFTEALGWIFEHSPWIAERAWAKRPFFRVSCLHHVMKSVVNEATMEKKLALLRAHPDLASRVQMANASIKEQSDASLDQLTEEEYEDFLTLNKAYTEKFGFPFIMAVRGQNKDSIRESIQERLQLSPETELLEALCQIYKIACFRLYDLINE
ncbi:2-oxo-4-hydroxy-4-carboxy-5-ureidoimidazoline decarboxylase [Bacillus chungangensis]|uniref:2-oxo-4-hydroxy-4-carboxy-5-ureidoimidazoline decarboxylase n=1 Tax=Bacillus chungangensis TaxID=587633 RepID=A0ABT9WSB3_9BACI|nr:2-oxo-4-hydroxy-4-carboxy-5-ureidoimidazoline decarboxylase [Bacillus chungangensis]MDQ0176071.1 OHCU decarboxylase [Bacillus chungangensis]